MDELSDGLLIVLAPNVPNTLNWAESVLPGEPLGVQLPVVQAVPVLFQVNEVCPSAGPPKPVQASAVRSAKRNVFTRTSPQGVNQCRSIRVTNWRYSGSIAEQGLLYAKGSRPSVKWRRIAEVRAYSVRR